MRYSWPGNVRELENLVRRLVVLNSAEIIHGDAVEAELTHTVAEVNPSTGDSLGTAAELHLRRYFTAHGGSLPARGLYDRVLREIERPLISLSLEATRGNQIRAADLLGLNRNTLRKKIRELDIKVARDVK
jgi:two-component system nitrogen regulation response regulator GlnG